MGEKDSVLSEESFGKRGREIGQWQEETAAESCTTVMKGRDRGWSRRASECPVLRRGPLDMRLRRDEG